MLLEQLQSVPASNATFVLCAVFGVLLLLFFAFLLLKFWLLTPRQIISLAIFLVRAVFTLAVVAVMAIIVFELVSCLLLLTSFLAE